MWHTIFRKNGSVKKERRFNHHLTLVRTLFTIGDLKLELGLQVPPMSKALFVSYGSRDKWHLLDLLSS